MIQVTTTVERWELNEPFATARDSITHIPVLLVTLVDADGRRGRAEAAGVDYDGETPQTMAAQVEGAAPRLLDSITGEALLEVLPPGGARNALDCALWDLRAKQSGVPAWRTAGLATPHPVTTVLTIGLCDDADTRRRAREARRYPILKLKVDADRHLDVVRIVREEHPSARLIVDANQGWSPGQLERMAPRMAELGVELIEQPLRRGEDASLEELRSVLPLAADESCTDRSSLAGLTGRYQYVNIKLDKSGGLTEALATCREATRRGFGLMVGNMCGTSLAMAPAFLVAQSCRFVDLDGPLLQKQDRDSPIHFEAGRMDVPARALWG